MATEYDNTSASPVNAMPLRLDIFEGPLDLLLHLVREQKLDIENIPIAKITEQYLAYIEVMRTLNLDVAGEFLVMAATLMYMKSKSLLPRREDEEDEPEDPEIMARELSRRLIEYERFKEAAVRLWERPVLGRDVFVRDFRENDLAEDEIVITELSMADLITAFKDALSRMPDETHEVFVERITIADAISCILDRINAEGSVKFESIVAQCSTRNEIISFFLGILELVRLKTIRVYQANPMGVISIVPAVRESEDGREPGAAEID